MAKLNQFILHLALLLFFPFFTGSAANYLCFTAGKAESQVWYENGANNKPNVQYSTDGNTWKDWQANDTILLEKVGDKIYVRGNNPTGFSHDTDPSQINDVRELECSYFQMTGSIAASGSVMSLVDGEGTSTTIPDGDGCFSNLFYLCKVLTRAPELPATKLAHVCYVNMFYYCSGMTEAPELPATTMADACYAKMFVGCTGLAKAPKLPATKLATNCYLNMFGSTNLTEGPELPATELAYGCYQSMFRNAQKLVKAPKLPVTTLAPFCYNTMFIGCTSLTEAPELPAKQLERSCYAQMFKGCTNLKYIKVGLETLENSVSGTWNWVDGVNSEGTFIFPCGSKYNEHGASAVPNKFTIVASPIVIFQNPDGTELWRDTIGCNVVPVYKGNPNPPSMGQGYTFLTWDKPLEVHTVPDIYYYTAIYKAPVKTNYLCFTAKEAKSTVGYYTTGSLVDLQYSYDGQDWTAWEPDVVLPLDNVDDKVYVKGDNPNGFSMSEDVYVGFRMTGSIAASGSVMSLLDGVGNSRVIPNDYCFERLFAGCTALVQAPELTATELTDFCYDNMFDGCGITQMSELPASNLAEGCYRGMFSNCAQLTETTSMSALGLQKECYKQMFKGCTSLVYAPSLIAKSMAESCYEQMFEGCTSLTRPPVLPAIEMAPSCYSHMFSNCTSLTSPASMPGVPMAERSCAFMYSGCTSLTSTSFLGSHELAPYCYTGMFQGCSKLTKVAEMPATELAEGCYSNMFSQCSSLTEAPQLPAPSLAKGCYENMFSQCTSLVRAPELMADTLKEDCYKNMFTLCSSLNYIKVGVITLDNEFDATKNWVSGVDGPGIFIFPCGSTYDKHGASEVPDSFQIISSPIVIFQNPDGEELWRDTVGCGETPNYEGPTPTYQEGLIFKNWDKELTALAEQGIYYYTAEYEFGDIPIPTDWLKLIVQEDGNFSYENVGGNNPEVEYSADWGDSWNTLEPGEQVTLEAGMTVFLRGNNPTGFSHGEEQYTRFNITGRVTVAGSIMSLIDGKGNTTEIPCAYCFSHLFENCDVVRGPSALPPLSMKPYCYSYMFAGCKKLLNTIHLPATELAPYCYKNMYTGTNIGAIDDLPATELAEGCYYEMFSDCPYLEVLPTSLPISKLADYCYCGMFSNCVALYFNIELPVMELAPYCYKNMFSGCTKMTKAPFLRALKMEKGCYANMFDGCVNIKEIVALPAETLSDSCYYNMFRGCTSLTEVPEMTVAEMKPACYEGMFSGCTNLVKAPELPASELVPSCYKNMFEGCSSLNYIKVGVMSLDNDFEATDNWVSGVDGPGTFIFPCGSTYDKHGASEVPNKFEIIGSPIVIFQNPDSTELWRDTIACDVAPKYQGKDPSIGEGYVFNGWDKELVPLEKSGIFYYTARYSVEGNPAMDKTLCFTAVKADSKIWVKHSSGNNPDIQYSVDRGETWIPLQEGDTVTLSNMGDRVYVKGDNPDGFYKTGYTSFGMSGKIEASGSVMSLIDGVGETDVIPCDSCFYRLFNLCQDALVKAPELPATTLTPSCYQFMFTNCTSLKEAPQLPATVMKDGCYNSMFWMCSSLERAPELPATQLATCCYTNMFGNCVSLTETPELPATELAVACYSSMFDRCDKLTKVTELPATKMEEGCYSAMFQSCKRLRVAPNLPAKELAKSCYTNMFEGCSVLTRAPELPATNLAEECYYSMFTDCECLTEAPELPASELKNKCYYYMFHRCISLSYIKVGVTSLDNLMQATDYWVYDVNNAGTFIFPCGSTYDKHGYSEVPMNFTIISSPIVVFQNPDGTELQRDTVDCETVPSYRGDGPTYGDGLTFQGWDPEPFMATDPGTTYYYTAQYKEEGDSTSGNWLCFTAMEADSRVAYLHTGANTPDVWYSINGGKDWRQLAEDETVTLENAGDKVYFKGNNPDGFSHGHAEDGTSRQYTRFVMKTGKIAASGSVMSLIDGEGTSTEIPNDFCFSNLFSFCTSLVQAPELPATKLTVGCYENMFRGCTSLEAAPELPATALADKCYSCMFMECENLTQAPELPAEEMEPYCYLDMFALCQKLENAPALRSTSLATGCYCDMFQDCHALVVAPELPATILAEKCYSMMFNNCISLTQAPELPATKMEKDCYSNMFSFCKSLVTPPSLPSNSLASDCYRGMFLGCENLSTAPELPAVRLDTNCYMGMFQNCTSLTQAPELPATSLVGLSYFNMFSGCTSLNYIKVGIMTLDNEYSATVNWVEGVDGPGVFIFPCGSTYDKHGSSQVPTNFEIGGYAYTIDSTIIAEGSYTRDGITYTESTSWSDSLQTAFGCDSVINYRLVIDGVTPAPVVHKDTAACDLFTFKDAVYTKDASWNDTLHTDSGDSIIVYHLTIHKSSMKDSTITAEGSFTWEGTTYTENTSWTETLQTIHGCDSIINYHLEIKDITTIPAVFTDKDTAACDMLVFKGITYTEDASWNDTLQTISGGDSIVTYHLTIHKSATTDSTITAEGSFTWKGNTFTESTSWSDTLQTIFGCDSVVNYRLVIDGITPAPIVHKDTSACDVLVFKGITYTQDASWNDTLQTASGGDSIIVYHLTIHKSVVTEKSITAEGSYTWKDITYTEDASWSDTLQTAFGCDSVVIYHLEIQSIEYNPIVIDKDLSACDSFIYEGVVYRESSEWNDTLPAANGGDSILAYHLTIHKSVTKDSSIIAEGSYTWKGTTYTEDTSWSDTLQTAFGCDSIVRYSLIVNEEKGPLELTVEDELYLVLPGGTETIFYELTGGEGSKYEVRYGGQTISSGDVTNDSTVSLTCPSSLEPGAYTATLAMYDEEGAKAEKDFTFNVMRPDDKQKSFYVKVWNDVVICRNGDGQFLTYQWYKERKKCENASQQYFNDVTLLDGEYMVFVTDKSGKSYFIEPITYEPVEAAYAITAEPNVVKKSEEFTVKVTGVAPDDLRNARIVVYRADGVVEKILDEVKEETVMRMRAGEFVFVLTVNDGKNANCKVLVK